MAGAFSVQVHVWPKFMTLDEIAPQLANDEFVNFGATSRELVDPPLGKSYWFRWGDVKHLILLQVQSLIGSMAAAGARGGARYLRVADGDLRDWRAEPSVAGYTEYTISQPVGVTQCIQLP